MLSPEPLAFNSHSHASTFGVRGLARGLRAPNQRFISNTSFLPSYVGPISLWDAIPTYLRTSSYLRKQDPRSPNNRRLEQYEATQKGWSTLTSEYHYRSDAQPRSRSFNPRGAHQAELPSRTMKKALGQRREMGLNPEYDLGKDSSINPGLVLGNNPGDDHGHALGSSSRDDKARTLTAHCNSSLRRRRPCMEGSLIGATHSSPLDVRLCKRHLQCWATSYRTCPG
jgi:hypothetical protein